MAIAQCMTQSFKTELWQGIHNVLTDSLMMALYTSLASMGYATTAYSSANEVSGVGYTPGGILLTGVTVGGLNGISFMSFNNPVWTAALTARGALIYNASKANRSVAVLDFGADKSSASKFTVQLPPNTYNSALLAF